MSGIFGTLTIDGSPSDPAALQRMLQSLLHRGVAGNATWCDGPIAMGQLALWPREDHKAVQVDHNDQHVLVADVRLDNRDDLCRMFACATGVPDQQLILRAYARWGEACPEHLLGDFAFAIWDAKEQRLFCARDHLGTRSFYYHQGTSNFLFATEIKALLAHGGVSRELDEGRIADYLGRIFADKTSTFYEAIKRLAPGHSLTVSAAGPRLRCYWQLDPKLRIERASDDAYADEFRSILTTALGDRMRGTQPIGVLLSGGLDSSALASIARQKRSEWGHSPLPTLSATFPDFPAIDERAFIDVILAVGHMDPTFVSASDTSPLAEIDATLECEDEPFYSPNLFVYWALAKAAKHRGLRALIDGVDGDTTVCHGLEYVAELCGSGHWIRAVREARGLAKRFGHPTRRFLWHFGIGPGILQPFGHWCSRLVGNGAPKPPTTMSPDFAKQVDWSGRLHELLGAQLRPARTLRDSHWRALTSALVPHYLEVNDKAASAFGMDHRHPYFDRRLVEFCYGTPANQKLSEGWDRVVQRRAMENILPKQLQWRVSKSDWGEQFKHGFLNRDRERLESILAGDIGELGNYVDAEALAATYRRATEGQVSEEDGMNLWLAITLGLWLEQRPK